MKGKICGLLAGCVLLAGCAGVPGTSAAQTATAESAPASVPAATAETAAATGKTLTVVLNGCIAYEVDSAGGSLKTAIAAADLVVYLAEEDVPADLGGRDRRLAAQPGRRAARPRWTPTGRGCTPVPRASARTWTASRGCWTTPG